MNLKGNTILITGGASGIGRGLTKALSRNNQVVVTGRDVDALKRIQQESEVQSFQSDMAKVEDIEQLAKQVIPAFPKLNILINNAGIMRNLDLNTHLDLGDVAQEIDINLAGPIRMVQAFVPHLQTRPASLVVNVTSGLAFVPLPIAPIYSAAKAGLHAYTRSLRAQLRHISVRVIELAPPAIETRLMGAFQKEFKGQKMMTVEKLVRHALIGIERDKEEITPGQSNILRLLGRFAPSFIFNQLAKTLPVRSGP